MVTSFRHSLTWLNFVASLNALWGWLQADLSISICKTGSLTIWSFPSAHHRMMESRNGQGDEEDDFTLDEEDDEDETEFDDDDDLFLDDDENDDLDLDEKDDPQDNDDVYKDNLK